VVRIRRLKPVDVIPERRAAANPEPMNTDFWNTGSRLGPWGRPGMTIGLQLSELDR